MTLKKRQRLNAALKIQAKNKKFKPFFKANSPAKTEHTVAEKAIFLKKPRLFHLKRKTGHSAPCPLRGEQADVV